MSENTLEKQGRSHESNTRSVLTFRETGGGHSAMTAFNKVMIMPAPATHRIFIKIQNANLLRVVKQLATDSTIHTTFEHRDKSGSIGECEVPIVGSGQKKFFLITVR